MSKRQVLSTYLLFTLVLLAWLLYGANYWNGDRDAYELYYMRESLASWGVEFGYGYLNSLFRNAGFSYQIFNAFISIATLLLILRFIVKRTGSPVLAFLFYLFLFFPLDYVLMRQTFAFAIALQGFISLYEEGRHSKVKFIFFILLASTMHQSAIFFLVFYFLFSDRVINPYRFILAFIVFLIFYIFFRVTIPLPQSVQAHFDVYKVSLKSALVNTFIHLFSVGLILLFAKLKKNAHLDIPLGIRVKKELSFILNLNLISCVWVVLYFESEIFIRLLRSLIFLDLFYAVGAFRLFSRDALVYFIAILLWSTYLVLVFLWPTMDLTVLPLVEKNLLWEIF